MRANLGIYFLGKVATFAYLVQTMKDAPQFDIHLWPQFALYNLLVANFWPVYWLAHFADAPKLNDTYWHIYMVAAERAADVMGLMQLYAK